MALTFEETTSRIEVLRRMKDQISDEEAELKLMKAEYQAHRETLLHDLQEAKVSSFKGETARVVITKRRDVQITDQVKAMQWLAANDFNIEEYIQIDTLRAKPVFKNALFEDGEKVDGVEPVETESLTITSLKPEAADA